LFTLLCLLPGLFGPFIGHHFAPNPRFEPLAWVAFSVVAVTAALPLAYLFGILEWNQQEREYAKAQEKPAVNPQEVLA
jgi:hypothetical protein